MAGLAKSLSYFLLYPAMGGSLSSFFLKEGLPLFCLELPHLITFANLSI